MDEKNNTLSKDKNINLPKSLLNENTNDNKSNNATHTSTITQNLNSTDNNSINNSNSTSISTNNSNVKKSIKKPNQNFYNVSDFPQLRLLDANYAAIKQELLRIIELEEDKKFEHAYLKTSYEKSELDDGEKELSSFFEPWIEKDLYEESNPDGWHIAPLMIGGNLITKNCNKAVFLSELIKEIPQLVSVSFSCLKPDTRIIPHKGYDEYSEKVLRYHLGLIIPKGDLGIRVNEDIKVWKEGNSFIFDDFQTHEAWNFTNEYRYVLICDFIDDALENNDVDNRKEIVFNDKKFKESISNYIK